MVSTHDGMCAAYTQQDVDAVFADMEYLLSEPPRDSVDRCRCVQCGGTGLLRQSCYDCELVCNACGVVQPGVNLPPEYFAPLPRKYSNYKRVHHWHERISQLLLMESPIPHQQFMQIAERLCDGTQTVLNKDSIRAVLRSLNMQLYIEKWLQIIQRVTGVHPPMPGPLLVQQLDDLFLQLQVPFDDFRMKGRKNFLNYNYVFCRLFQKLGCPQFCMFFPLIKSKPKLKALDDTWVQMAKVLDWPVPPLPIVPAFAVALESPMQLIRAIKARDASRDQAEKRSEHRNTSYHWTHHESQITDYPQPKLRRSDQLVLRRLESSLKRARYH